MITGQPTFRQKLAAFMGVKYLPGGEPNHFGGPSRYAQGFGLSPRLDEDVDALMTRVAALEALLAEKQ